MEYLSGMLPIVIYLLLIVLLIVAIIFGIKLIIITNKVDVIVDDVNDKLNSLDKLFSIIDFATNKISLVSDTLVKFITTNIKKLFKKERKSKKNKEEIENE